MSKKMKVLNGDIKISDAGKQSAQSLLDFLERLINFLKLSGVRIATREERKTEQKLETLVSKLVIIQQELISQRTKKNEDVLQRLGQVKNELRNNF